MKTIVMMEIKIMMCLLQDLDDVMKQFDVLKQKKWNQSFQLEAAERLKNVLDEVEKMKQQVDDKLSQILGSSCSFI